MKERRKVQQKKPQPKSLQKQKNTTLVRFLLCGLLLQQIPKLHWGSYLSTADGSLGTHAFSAWSCERSQRMAVGMGDGGGEVGGNGMGWGGKGID